MRHDARTIGLLLIATASVYSGRAVAADANDAAAREASAADALRALTALNPGAAATPTDAAPKTYFSKVPAAHVAANAEKPTVVIPVPPVPGESADALAREALAAARLMAAQANAAPAPLASSPAPLAEQAAPVDPFAPQTTDASGSQSPFGGADPIPADPFGPSPAGRPRSNAAPAGAPAAAGATPIAEGDVAFDGNAGTVEIHVNGADLVEVLRMLSLQSQKNIIASKHVTGTVTANLYNVTVREALDAILSSTGFGYRERGNFIYVYTDEELKAMEARPVPRETRVFRCYYTPVATVVNMIKPVMSETGEVAFTDPARSGLDSGTGDAGGNSHATEDVMVVTDFPERLDEIARVLKEIDKRPQQILIEATILRAALSEDNSLGVDFQVLGGVDFSGLGAAGATVGSATGGAIVDNAAAGGVVNKGFGGAGTDFTSRGLPGGGLQVGVVKNNIAVFLEALEQVTDTTVLANPKILALNKQKGEVIVGRKDGYLTTTVTQTTSVQSVEFLDTGTRLIFRPYIGDDGFIRMEIHPEDSSGGLSSGNLPFKVTTEVTSNVLVKDGHTVVIGGLFREDSSSARAQVPILGNIPIAGALFRSQRDRTTREEVIILLTPHIIKDEAAYSQLSEQELRRMDQLRVGVRRGMMSSGRERLAEGFYDSAVAEMNRPKPDTNKALWNLNAATNLNPKFLEAIELKRQVTRRRLDAVDNSVGRNFVRQLALADPMPMTTTRPTTPMSNDPMPTPVPMPVLMPATRPTTTPSTRPVAVQPTTMPIE